MIRTLLLLVSMTASGAVFAATTYTRFLLPIYADVIDGASGSRWEVTGWVHNQGAEEAHIVPRPLCGPILCPLGALLHPKSGPLPMEPLITESNAMLVHVDAVHASDVRFALRVKNRGHEHLSIGTELPVVPEWEFRPTAISLLSIPFQPGYRVALRIYGLPETPAPEVEVRYSRMPGENPYRDSAVLLRTDRVSLQAFGAIGEYRLEPSLAALGNVQSLPELEGEAKIWITITPLTPGLRVWGFATVTSNVTHEVTVVRP